MLPDPLSLLQVGLRVQNPGAVPALCVPIQQRYVVLPCPQLRERFVDDVPLVVARDHDFREHPGWVFEVFCCERWELLEELARHWTTVWCISTQHTSVRETPNRWVVTEAGTIAERHANADALHTPRTPPNDPVFKDRFWREKTTKRRSHGLSRNTRCCRTLRGPKPVQDRCQHVALPLSAPGSGLQLKPPELLE